MALGQPARARAQAIALLGPTASGKSRAAMQLAEELELEIVSVDSAQVYRQMDVGTAKPTAADRARVAHHLIDLGAVQPITRTELYFVKPTAGHAYWLEYSRDGKHWKPYGAERALMVESPHIDRKKVRARYLRLHVLKGEAGLWEFKIFD